jgi:hypothetical protein
MAIILRSKVGDQITSNFQLNGENILHIHLIAKSEGFEWKITRSQLVREGTIKKWKGDGKGFVFTLGNTDPTTGKELEEFLTEVGAGGELREKFEEKMSVVACNAVEKWGVGRSGRERK